MATSHENLSAFSTSVIICALFGGYSLAKFIAAKIQEASLSEYASFAELNGDVQNLDDIYNETVFELSKRCDFSRSEFALLNPPLEGAHRYFHAAPKIIKTEMLQRNSYLLSRIFIQNISKHNLNQFFQEKVEIKVLDVGCSLPVSLPGLLAYFNPEKVKYHGVDNDKGYIDDSNKIFKKFKNTQFSWLDANQFLQKPSNQQLYDIILFQHPNLSTSEQMTEDFISMFINAQQALAPGGIMYLTFYYPQEAASFIDQIAPLLTSLTFYPMQNSNLFKRKIEFDSPQGLIKYSPELFTIASMPKVRLEHHESFENDPSKLKIA